MSEVMIDGGSEDSVQGAERREGGREGGRRERELEGRREEYETSERERRMGIQSAGSGEGPHV